jgi:hypothetical protein
MPWAEGCRREPIIKHELAASARWPRETVVLLKPPAFVRGGGWVSTLQAPDLPQHLLNFCRYQKETPHSALF